MDPPDMVPKQFRTDVLLLVDGHAEAEITLIDSGRCRFSLEMQLEQ